MQRPHIGLPVLFLTAIMVSACSSDEAGYDDEHEEEPMGSTDSALTGVDCKTTRMTAYDRGKAFPIDVITIGSKRAAKPTGHAFLKMQKAAQSAGVALSLSSGFRTNDEQKYFYNCYQTKKCNSGNIAARPGYSNHQSGRALDLSTSSWLAKNAAKFGFRRTVAGEPWHYEYDGADPGGPCSSSAASTATNDPPGADDDNDNTPAAPNAGTGKTCSSDGQCNPGNDGSGLICTSGKCVDGCRSNAQCPGATTCQAGKCQ